MTNSKWNDYNHIPITGEELADLPNVLSGKSKNIEEKSKFEELKRLTLEALNNKEYGSGLYIREAHYFIAGSSDKDHNRVEFGSYPIYLLEEYNKFIEDNLPKIE